MATKTKVKADKSEKKESGDFIDEGLAWLGGVLFDGPAKEIKKVTKEVTEETDDGEEDDGDEETAAPDPKPKSGGNRARAAGTGNGGTAASAPVTVNISGLFREPGKPVTKRKPPAPPAEEDGGEAEGE